jgi:hypothetical protein
MSPKKRHGKELPIESSSQAVEGQVFTTAQTTVQITYIPQTAHPQPSTEPCVATTETRRPEDPVEQPTTQAEVLAMNTSTANTLPPPLQQHQAIETQEYQQQDSEEEIKAIIKDERARLCQGDERLRHMQEHMARRRAVERRSQIMQQQIE